MARDKDDAPRSAFRDSLRLRITIAVGAVTLTQLVAWPVVISVLLSVKPTPTGALVTVAALFGLELAVIAVWTVVAPRHVMKKLTELTRYAHHLANRFLPGVVDDLRQGKSVDPASAVPPITGRPADEFDVLLRDLGYVGLVAAESTVEASTIGQQRDDMANLARRLQSGTLRLLKNLDELQQGLLDPDLLRAIFDIQQQGMALRRTEENLIILAGKSLPTWKTPTPISAILHSAQGELEDYSRIDLEFGPDLLDVQGNFAPDVIRVVAELMDNAATCSPPTTNVSVTAEMASAGLAITISDRGNGLTAVRRDELNALLNHHTGQPVSLGDIAHLGLNVVAELARRRNLTVTFRPSLWNGLEAIVLVPRRLLVPDTDRPDQPHRAATQLHVGVDQIAGPVSAGRGSPRGTSAS